jgi:hypothetical protein
MLSLQGIPRDAFLRSAVFEAEEPDLAGNPIRVSFLAGSYYEKRGFLIPNALGWYDQIGVHYEAIEPLAGPRDLGNAAEADVRQGHDSRSRMLLALRDPDSVGAPIVIYAASYSGGIRYVMAYTTDGYGQWVEYRCQRSAPVLAGRSEIQIRDVERTLVSVARTICDPMLSPAATSTAPPAAPMMLAGDWVATSHSVGKVGAPLGDYFDTGDVVRECNGTAHFKPVDRQQLNEHATHYGRHSLNVAQGQIASYGDHAYILTLDSECVDSVLVGRDVGHLRATHVKVDFAVAAQEEDTLHVWTDDGRVAFALTPDGWLFKSSNCQASGDRTKVPCGARLLISRKH